MPKCKGCGKEILWIKMNTSGNMPVDPKSEKRICFIKGIGHIYDTYMPHWATCEKADQFKKEK